MASKKAKKTAKGDKVTITFQATKSFQNDLRKSAKSIGTSVSDYIRTRLQN